MQEEKTTKVRRKKNTRVVAEPVTIEWQFPLWQLAQSVEPILKVEKSRGDSRQQAKDSEALSELSRLMHEIKGDPVSRHWIRTQTGWQLDKVNRIVKLGIDTGRIAVVGTRTGRNNTVADLLSLVSYVTESDDNTEQAVNGSF